MTVKLGLNNNHMTVQDRRPTLSDGTLLGEGVKPDENDDAVVDPA